ncbi:alginate export family protein [Aquifex pyrophilus]
MRRVSLLSLALFSSLFAIDFSKEAKVNLELRPRYEYVDVDQSGKKEANALTVRIRTGITFKELFSLKGLDLTFEPWVVTALVRDYAPERSNYELVPDPEQVRINQVFLSYGGKAFNLKVGRQIITFDNHRFIGNVGWRQMAQTFDAVRLDLKPFKDTTITLAYVAAKTGVTEKELGDGASWAFAPDNTNIGDDVAGNDSILFHANYTYKPLSLNITPYAYLLNGMHDTYGLKLNGKMAFQRSFFLSYWLEFAYQKDPTLTSHENGKKNIGASYYFVSLKPGYKFSGGKVFLIAEYEFMEGKDGDETHGFTTPWATLHAHNGWADVFLKYTGTSNQYGLEDARIGIGFKHGKIGVIKAVYHNFKADKSFPGGGDKFGNELDVIYKRKIFKNLHFGAKAAFYDADSEAKNAGLGDKDVTKYWVWLTYKWSR